MKKTLAILLVLAMSLALLTACGSSDIPPNRVFKVDDLEGKVIGVQLGTTGDIYAGDYEADDAEVKAQVERYNKGADAVLALTQGKVDCVVIDNEPAKAFVSQNQGLKILDEPFENEDYAVAIAKDNDKLTTEFNKALKELKEDGTVQKIIDNFIGDDTKGKSPYKTPPTAQTLPKANYIWQPMPHLSRMNLKRAEKL